MNKKRWLALLVAFVMLLGMFPFTASAEDEINSGATETFMCGLEESVGHKHGEECYCTGGEYLCASDETEEHLHTEVCVCPGGELRCLSDEFDGHTHSETCVAKSDEPVSGAETTALSDDNHTKALLPESEYEDLKQLFADDESIAFDPATQTLLVIEAEHMQTAHLQSLGLANVEDAIQWDGEENGYKTPYMVSINGEKVKKDYPYYIVSKDTKTIAEMKVSNAWGFGEGKVFLSADNNKVAVLIVNRGDTYDVAWEMNGKTFYDAAVTGQAYNGYGLCPFPTNHQTRTAYSGTAGNAVVTMPFSFEWDLYNWFDTEIWVADLTTKTLDNPGFLNLSGYIDFKIELRDQNGNISLLPRSFFNNIGSGDDYIYMAEDGIVSVPFEAYDDDLLPHSTPYGEFDILLPFGYDYRISLVDYSVDTLGAYAYVINQEHGYDAEGFCITDKSTEYNEDKEWGSWLAFTFMPCTQTIRVEKQAQGSDSADTEYSFAVKQTAYTYSELGGYSYLNQPDVMQNLSNYPYDLYDSETGEKINEVALKTDGNGKFELKSGQYAELKVWEVPEDVLDYERWGTNFIDDIYTVYSEVQTESEYTFEELGAEDCATKITHKRGDAEATVSGKKIENVLGNDRILFWNIYDRTGSLTIRKEVSGSGTPDSDTTFEFIVTRAGAAAVGKYTVGNGAEQTIPADGKISLKAGESALLTELAPGEYTVTESTPTQPNYISTGFSVNHETPQTGLTATVTVTSAAAASTGGWQMKNGAIAKDANGYFVYTITKDHYDRCMRITFDHGNRPVSTAWDDSATPAQDVSSVKSYLDKTDAARENVLAAMNQGNQIADGATITLDNMRGYVEVPNAWSVFRYYDFGFELIFRADTVPEDEQAASVVFTNYYQRNDLPSPEPDQETGELEVSVTVSGNDADRTKDFTFTVTLSDASVNGTYGEMTFENGVAVFALKDGESKTARSLPGEISYTVEESDNAGYTVTVNGSSQTTASGSIVANTTVKAAFNNHKEDLTPDENTMEVTVMKVWADNGGEGRPSTVKVRLYKDGEAYGESVILNAENGWAHTWAHLDSAAAWTVDEVEIPNGYSKTVTHSGNDWTITNTLKERSDLPNTPDTQPPLTGDYSQIGLWTALACLSLVLMLALVLYMKRFSAQK